MAYRCECGNTHRFLEVFDTAIDVVNNAGSFLETKDRNVAYYKCPECDRDIDYEDFWAQASGQTPAPIVS